MASNFMWHQAVGLLSVRIATTSKRACGRRVKRGPVNLTYPPKYLLRLGRVMDRARLVFYASTPEPKQNRPGQDVKIEVEFNGCDNASS